MDIEVLKSYLVSLGFDINQKQLGGFENALKQASGMVETNVGGMLKSLFKVQAGISGSFTALSSGVVAMADHVAMADQKYRLLGMRMFLTKDAARTLDKSLEALGATLEDVAWDPELRSHFLQLKEDQERWSESLGVNYDANMRGIRDLRFEFSRLKLLIEFVSMRFINSIFKAFGTDVAGAQEKLRHFTEWLTERLPAAGDELAKNFVPILKTTWTVISEIGEALGETAVMFTNFIGLLTGDDSIKGTTLDFQKMAGAIQHVVGWLGTVMHWLVSAEKMLVHFADAAILAFGGKFKEAKAELAAGFKELGPSSGAIAGAVVGGVVGSIVPGAGTAAGAAWGMGIGATLGGLNNEVQGRKPSADDHVGLQIAAPDLPQQQSLFPASTPSPSFETAPAATEQRPVKIDPGPIAELVRKTAEAKGVDPRLAQAVAHQESGTREYDKHGNVITSGAGAMGVMQLMPKTAAGLGVDPRDTAQNVSGGVTLLAGLLQRYHQDVPKALAAYNWGQGNLDKAIARHTAIPQETLNYVRNIMSNATGQQVSIGDVQISIMQPNASAQEIAHATKKGISEAMAKQRQRTMAQLAFVG